MERRKRRIGGWETRRWRPYGEAMPRARSPKRSTSIYVKY
jgi:hypothetical protein